MPDKEALQREWFEIAKKDFWRAELHLSASDPGGAAFYVQQAAEKALKGYMLARGWKLERTHDLEALLDAAVDFQPDLERFRHLCHEGRGFYMAERYPSSTPLADEDVRKNLQDCRKLLKSVGVEL